MADRLKGKIAIVTGAAPQAPGVGIGSAVATLFAREGAHVVLVNRSSRRARELQKAIDGEGNHCSVFQADISKAKDVRALIENVRESHGRLDILVNNVGVFASGTVETQTEEEWDRLMSVNLKGTMWCCKYAVPLMKAGESGSIVNISTAVASRGVRIPGGVVAYAASKAGVDGLTRALAADHAADGIRVNGVVVGTVWTARLAARLGEEARQRLREQVPLKTEGTGWDVAWAAVFLASDEARWVTGAFLPVDGGALSISRI